MRTKYKFIHFVKDAVFDCDVWDCHNNKTDGILGEVSWYKRWNQWIFEPEDCCAFSADCLADIQHFMGQLPKEGPKVTL